MEHLGHLLLYFGKKSKGFLRVPVLNDFLIILPDHLARTMEQLD